jgi:hypothetical protein
MRITSEKGRNLNFLSTRKVLIMPEDISKDN